MKLEKHLTNLKSLFKPKFSMRQSARILSIIFYCNRKKEKKII